MLVTASTILDTPANVRRFVADNLAMGVDHMVVFLDDPLAPDQDQVADELSGHGQVTCVPTGRDWWAGDRPQGLNVRQRINVNVALELLADMEWAQWVFHIDGDEVVALDREVLAAPTNSAYFHGHILGKSGVRPGSGLRLTLHNAVTKSGDRVPRHKDPRLRVHHHDAVSGEEFVRKRTALLGAGPARFREDRAPTINALRTLTGKDIPAPIAEKYLRRIYEATTEDDVTTLHELGLLDEVDPGQGTHVPEPTAESDRAALAERFAEMRDVPKRPYHVIQRPRPAKAKAKSRRQRRRGLRARVWA